VEDPLRKRITDHQTSIRQVENLELTDFSYRYLVTNSLWVPLGEYAFIRRYQPIWNVLIDGFGNRAPGGGRQRQVRSRWDTLHPGRPAAARLRERDETSAQIIEDVLKYFATGGLAPAEADQPPALAIRLPPDEVVRELVTRYSPPLEGDEGPGT
jgi:hypothetical protein